ncbi:MAG: hypothetical protein GX027_04855 [Clostridiaceae bacterium]|nr:hypothetical protein [Clostridiaceae bacterium]
MEYAAKWFKESLVCRMMESCGRIWRYSLMRRGLMGLGNIISCSCISKRMSSFFHRRFRPRQVFTYRILRRLQRRLVPLKIRVSKIIGSSFIWRIGKGSGFMRLLSRFFIPLSVFFVFIDELGRTLFGEKGLFGIWDEIYLLLCVLLLCLGRIMDNGMPTVTATPMDIPIFLLISVSFFLYLNFSPYPHIGFEGMRGVAQLTLWFYVFSRYLDSDRKSERMTGGLILAGGILGIHGIIQYAAGVETPANWMDAAEGVRSVRVFSVVGSPNILGSLMVLIIPIALAQVLQNRTARKPKAFYLILLASMAICLVLTLSRGAWLGMAVAFILFSIAWNPKWMACMAFAGGMVFLVPSVQRRISYMLSPRYITSSVTGGRLFRYKTGWEMFMNNMWTGVGQGHFGGAVAMNNRDLFPNSFYMDSYWLKTAVEMGILGLAAWFVVICALLVWSVRAIRTTMDRDARLVIIGGFSGMMGVLVHNLFENVFEVPYMAVYFWMVAAIVFYNYSRGQFRVV